MQKISFDSKWSECMQIVIGYGEKNITCMSNLKEPTKNKQHKEAIFGLKKHDQRDGQK